MTPTRIWTAVITKELHDTDPTIDWTSGALFGRTWALFIMFEFATMATQSSLYWIVGHCAFDPFPFVLVCYGAD
jgi:hypothetical protein